MEETNEDELYDFFFYFTNPQNAKHLSMLLANKKFYVESIHPTEDKNAPWCLIVSYYIKSEKELNRLVVLLEYYATEFEGEFDGCESAIVL